ncbi:hypothetical protein [Enterococcus sp. AZ102]|uniref:hypothetical protein n=1 Tax=Enterococcus sp. AZ102 TaxID=2774865 RepID=UPI003F26A719
MIRHTDSDKERPIYKLVHSAPVESFNDFHVSFWKLDRAELVDLLQSFSEHGELTLVQLKKKDSRNCCLSLFGSRNDGTVSFEPINDKTIYRYRIRKYEIDESQKNQDDYYIKQCEEQGGGLKHELQSKWKQLSKKDFLEDKGKTRLMDFGIQSQSLSFEI